MEGKAMEEQNRVLSITLKSDLCAGSGYSYGGILDHDVCYDDMGLPYIPARRIKGCLREAAEKIGIPQEEIIRIFGESGSDRIRGVIIENARLEHYEKLYQELKRLPEDLKEYITPQSILEQFTVVKTQTKIGENGVAKDKLLRSFRSIKHYSPMEQQQEMKFFANIKYVELTEEDITTFGQIVKALRNMGLNRNRGLGSVKCALEWKEDGGDGISPEKNKDKEYKIFDLDEIKEEEAVYQLSYKIKNKAPLVFNTEHNFSTEKYITGQTMLGYLAAAYLRKEEKTRKEEGTGEEEGAGKVEAGETEEFKELFLKNQVIFSNLYPCDEPETVNQKENACKVYYPAPLYINQMKKTGKYVNITKFIPETENECDKRKLEKEYASEHGNRPRRLHDKFIWTDGVTIGVKEVETELVYHHTKKSEKQNSSDGDLLYSFEAICPQQYFSGNIIGKGKYIKIIAKLLEHNHIQLGKSKSSQYGNCILAEKPKIQKLEETKKKYARGCKILVTLQSDGIFLNETGYTVNCNEVREIVRSTLKIKEAKSSISDKLYSELQVRKLVGFYGKWNLKRQAIPAVCAGSTFEFLLGDDLEISEQGLYAGERNAEGYGKLYVIENNSEDCCLPESGEISYKPEDIEWSKELCKKILLGEMKENLLKQTLPEDVKMKNSTMVGKITLMLAESIQNYQGDREKAYQDFCKKIEDIKEKEKKEQILALKNSLICEGNELDADKLQYRKFLEELIERYQKYIDGKKENISCKKNEKSNSMGMNSKNADDWKQNTEYRDVTSQSMGQQNMEHTDKYNPNMEKLNDSGKKEEEIKATEQSKSGKDKVLSDNKALGEELKQELKKLWSDYFMGILVMAKYQQKEMGGEQK